MRPICLKKARHQKKFSTAPKPTAKGEKPPNLRQVNGFATGVRALAMLVFSGGWCERLNAKRGVCPTPLRYVASLR
ncbi:MAG: hypothetical protein IJV69_07720 [Kiritimatiellae bacterium]|nr:hypothetical protein [Kiritimatiellia bacterium]